MIYHGCGHFWYRVTLRFDLYDEIVEGYVYLFDRPPPWFDRGVVDARLVSGERLN